MGPTNEARSGKSYVDLTFVSASFTKLFEYERKINHSLNSDSDHHPIIIDNIY